MWFRGHPGKRRSEDCRFGVHPIKPLIFIGVDPGLKGAIAFFRPSDRRLVVYDMPNRPRPSGKNEVCPNVLSSHVQKFSSTYSCIAVVEKVAAMTGKESSASSFQFGRSFGIILGVMGALQITAIETRPNVWKSMIGLSSDKNASLDKVRDIFPAYTHLFKRKMDDGRAEASLLAWMGQRLWT